MAELKNQSIQNNNSLSNFTQATTEISAEESLEFKYTKVTFYFLILFCATFGNSMVIYVICTSKKMRSSSHLLILNLAICDLFTPLVSIPFDFALEENGYVWMYGHFMCKILYPAATFSSTASSLTLAAISLDRYRLLMHPFKKKLSSNQIKGIIIGVYIFSALAVSPYTYGLRLEEDLCQEHWSGNIYRQLYTLGLFLFQYAIPLIFMTIMYTLAIMNLLSTSGKVRNCSITSNTPTASTGGTTAPKGLNRIKMSLKRKLSPADENPNIRATKMFMAVVTVFAIFMFPNQVLWIWADFGDGASQPHFSQTAIICWLFTYTNSVVNPIIFAIFSKDFRVGFKGVFRLIFCCNRKALPERCLSACEGQTKTDSSTNEILSEKNKTIQDFSTCHFNTQEKEISSVLTKNTCDDVTVFDKTGDLKDKLDAENFSSKLFIEAPTVKKNELPPAYSDLAQQIDSTHGLTKALIEFPSSDELKKNGLLPELEYNDELIDNQVFGPKMKDSVIPVLHPNAVAILEDLPETDC